ncbi:MAG: aminotransferase class I/II-fold pyridoxal phosphate-dependent enzyme [Bacilli bacterium]|nr:aminotransferase class I/II-fold pyridoxal phosphate-dependent enzyme [Bacilli bacterium]
MANKYNFDQKIDRRKTHSYKWDVSQDEISLSIADTDFLVANEIQEAIISRSNDATYGYTFVPNEYYKAYIHWWKNRYGLDLKEEYFIFSTSVVASIDSIIKRISKVGDYISLFAPNYNVFFNCIENNNRKVLEIPFVYKDYQYSIDWDLFEKEVQKSKIFILCNPHNPIGIQFSENEIKRIVEICKKYNIYIISDEIHSDLDYNEKRYNPVLKFVDYEKAIMLVSPGKTFNLAGLHSSVIIIRDKDLRELIQKGVYEDDVGEPSYFSIEPVIAAYTKCEQYVNEENEYIKENRRILAEFLVKNDIKMKIISGFATYLLWIDISYYSNDSEAFTEELKRSAKIIVGSGKHYHEHYSSFIRINIATQKEIILQFCNRLLRFLKERE